MGFISTGDSTHLTAYFTQRGRELLLNGTEEQKTAAWFSLGDSDSNYHMVFPLNQGYVPDVTGDNLDCVLSLASNVGIKYNISYNNIIPQPKSQVMFQRPDNGQYYATLDCLVNLDKISRFTLFNSSGNRSVTDNQRLPAFQNLASPLRDLYTQIGILINPSLTPVNTDFAPNDSMVFEMLFDANVYKKLTNTYIDTNINNTVNQTGSSKSPIILTFSSLLGTGSTVYLGAGNATVGLFNREIGYLYRPINSTDTWEFYTASNFEGVKNYSFYVDNNNALLNQYSVFTIAAKIVAKDNASGTYKTFIYRGDKNLININDTVFANFNEEVKFANQFTKMFADDYPIIDSVRAAIDSNTPIIEGLVQKEVSTLRDFVQTSGLFHLIAGTNEYRTDKLSFSVYPKNNPDNVNPAVLNLIFKFDNDEVLNGDSDYSHISDGGDVSFIQYDFTATNGVFQNKAKSGTFIKNNCGANFNGSSVNYVVPAGTYTGATQAAADTAATNDVNANGQAYANTQGSCTPVVQYYSSVYSQYIQRNNCPPSYQGSNVLVQYAAGQFTSTVNQSDADYQAAQAAQLLANSQGTCTYAPPTTGGGGGGCLLAGQKIIINENGDSKNIEDFQINDSVFTYHEKTLELSTYRVYGLITGQVDEWYNINTVDGKTINCSPSHLFMVNNNKKRADELTTNDYLQYSLDGKLNSIEISTIIKHNETVNIYNVEVEDAHTYLTENLIWQHNNKAPISDTI